MAAKSRWDTSAAILLFRIITFSEYYFIGELKNRRNSNISELVLANQGAP